MHWLNEEFPNSSPLPARTSTRRLATSATASGEWMHTRVRPRALMAAAEPLLGRVTHWVHIEHGAAVRGFSRTADQ